LCPAMLEPAKSCKVMVTFTPIDTTPQTGTLTIPTNGEGPPSVPLSGTGKALKVKK
jgi:hypothetical protein